MDGWWIGESVGLGRLFDWLTYLLLYTLVIYEDRLFCCIVVFLFSLLVLWLQV